MSKIQTTLWVCVSVCFLGVMALLGNPFRAYENIYRAIPFYCRMEEQAKGVLGRMDRDTAERIVEANGAYLGRERNRTIQEEMEKQASVEQAQKLTEEITREQQREKQQQKEKEKKPPRLKEHPQMELSAEALTDPQYVMKEFFIVDEGAAVREGQIDAPFFLEKDLTVQQNPSLPQIAIYHSHSRETFADSRPGEEADTIVGVGDYLAEILRDTYGYNVIHVREHFDIIDGREDRNAAYDMSGAYMEKLLAEHPSVEVSIDLHRDGVDESRRLVTEIDGKPTAQIMFYNGLSYTPAQGAVEYLPNPYIQDNLAFSFQLAYEAARYYPGFDRGIYLAGLRYNLHLRPRAMLLEAGAQTNTVQEVKNAMEPFAALLHQVLSEKA